MHFFSYFLCFNVAACCAFCVSTKIYCNVIEYRKSEKKKTVNVELPTHCR